MPSPVLVCMFVCVCACNGLFIYLLMASDIYNVQTCEPHLLNGKKKGEVIAEKKIRERYTYTDKAIKLRKRYR